MLGIMIGAATFYNNSRRLVDDAQVLDAIGLAALEQIFERLLLLRPARDHERTGELVAEVQIPVERHEHLVPLPAQLCVH